MDVVRLLRDARLVRSVEGSAKPADTSSLVVVHQAEDHQPAKSAGADYVGFYFSSGDRNFTPVLQAFFERFSSRGKETSSLEIVSVNAGADDEDALSDENFGRHLRDTPWLAVSNTDRTLARNLRRALRVDIERSGALVVVVDARTGQVVSRNGRSRFEDDPDGASFPWFPPNLDSLLGDGADLVDSAGAQYDQTAGNIDFKLLYFSANWCPPCKAFTPQLVKTCEHLTIARTVKLQVIFVSFDRSHESFDQYFGGMPATWLAVPYADETRRKELAELFLVQGIPSLVVLDGNNKMVTRDARHEVAEDPDGQNFPWTPHLVEVLTGKFSLRLNENPFLVLFTDGNEEELEQAKTILWPIAEELVARNDAVHLAFFVAGEDDVCDSLRDFAQLEDVVPLLVIVDTVVAEKYVLDDDVELSTDIVRRFVWRFLDGSLQAAPLFAGKSE